MSYSVDTISFTSAICDADRLGLRPGTGRFVKDRMPYDPYV
jgi:hypothetical protein